MKRNYQKRNYEDIINLPHPISQKHPQMSALDRAAQFSPFAALTGHEDAIKETARLVDEQITLDEDEKAMLDLKLQEIKANIAEHPKVEITYFKPDISKQGGAYETIYKSVKKIDEFERKLILEEDVEILFENLVQIEVAT